MQVDDLAGLCALRQPEQFDLASYEHVRTLKLTNCPHFGIVSQHFACNKGKQ